MRPPAPLKSESTRIVNTWTLSTGLPGYSNAFLGGGGGDDGFDSRCGHPLPTGWVGVSIM